MSRFDAANRGTVRGGKHSMELGSKDPRVRRAQQTPDRTGDGIRYDSDGRLSLVRARAVAPLEDGDVGVEFGAIQVPGEAVMASTERLTLIEDQISTLELQLPEALQALSNKVNELLAVSKESKQMED